MNCLACADGAIERLISEKNRRGVFVCDLCEAAWTEGELDDELGLTIGDILMKDQEHQPIRKTVS